LYADYWGEVILDGKNNTWVVDGDFTGGESYIESLVVKTDSTIYFDRSDPDPDWYDASLHIDNITFLGDSVLKLSGGLGGFYLQDHGAITQEAMRHIAIEDASGKLWKPTWHLSHGRWNTSMWNAQPWVPLPEASTYGAAFSFSALAVGFIRKRKRRKPLSLIPSGVRV